MSIKNSKGKEIQFAQYKSITPYHSLIGTKKHYYVAFKDYYQNDDLEIEANEIDGLIKALQEAKEEIRLGRV